MRRREIKSKTLRAQIQPIIRDIKNLKDGKAIRVNN